MAHRQVDSTIPASRGLAVTNSDSTALIPTRGLYTGTGGDIKVTLADQSDAQAVTFAATNAGTVLPVQAIKVWATGTTASSIIALY